MRLRGLGGSTSGDSASVSPTFPRWTCMSASRRRQRIKLGVTDIETGASTRARAQPLALTRQAVPRRSEPQIPQVPGGGAPCQDEADARQPSGRSAFQVRFSDRTVCQWVQRDRNHSEFPAMGRAMPMLNELCRFAVRYRGALQVDRDKPAPCASACEVKGEPPLGDSCLPQLGVFLFCLFVFH